MDQGTLMTPATPGPRRPALHLRPCPVALREALRELAQAEGVRLYQYLLAVLAAHVDDRRRSARAVAAPAPERTSI
jgi:hypothetical protein